MRLVTLVSSAIRLTVIVLRGVCEREWFSANPGGTRPEFKKYFKKLSEGELQVCRAPADDDSTNIAPQKFREQVDPSLVISTCQVLRMC